MQHADRLYSPERIAEFEAQRTARAAAYAAAAAEGGAVVEEEPTVEPESEEEEEEEDDSIEASIARELAALKEERKGGKSGTLSEKKRKTGDRKKNRPRFQSVKTDCDCRMSLILLLQIHFLISFLAVCFVATAWPYDPVELTESIVTELQATAVSQTRCGRYLFTFLRTVADAFSFLAGILNVSLPSHSAVTLSTSNK